MSSLQGEYTVSGAKTAWVVFAAAYGFMDCFVVRRNELRSLPLAGNTQLPARQSARRTPRKDEILIPLCEGGHGGVVFAVSFGCVCNLF